MNLSRNQKKLIAEALTYEAKQLEEYLSHTNASQREWQKVSDLYALSTDFELNLLDDTYV